MEKIQLEALNETVKEILEGDNKKICAFLQTIASSYCSRNIIAAARLNDWVEGNKEYYSMIPETQLRKDIAIGILLTDILPFVTLEYMK